VGKGARVQKGQVIAEVGATGNASAPHLHFEVRRDDDPRDPLLFLP
jgi:murein DD-endopeptidase MepM/ murein hydrolase activator NlpD